MSSVTNRVGWVLVAVVAMVGLEGPVQGSPTGNSVPEAMTNIQDVLDPPFTHNALRPLANEVPKSPSNSITPATVLPSFGRLPLSFEENHGQVDGQVKYLARGKGYSLFLTETEAVLSLRSVNREALGVNRKANADEALSPHASPLTSPDAPLLTSSSGDPPSSFRSPLPSGERARVRGEATKDHKAGKGESETSIIRMTFEGANQAPKVSGNDKLPGIVNYFIGDDSDQWRTKIPTYKKVQYDNLYDGIDLVYYGNQGQFEYDLVVAPGADPSQIQLAFEGTDNISVDPATGDLVLSLNSREALGVKRKANSDKALTPDPSSVTSDDPRLTPHALPLTSSTLRLLKPHVYQMVDGKKVEVAANYVLLSEEKNQKTAVVIPAQTGIQASFRHPRESGDPGEPQTKIDSRPLLNTLQGQAQPAGMTNGKQPAGMTEKGHANSPHASRFTPHEVRIQLASYDITKPLIIDPVLFFSTYLGGGLTENLTEFGASIAVDAIGQTYITGSTISANFPTCPNVGGTTPCATAGTPVQGIYGNNSDAFVTKLNAAGTELVYSTYLGGSGGNGDVGSGIAVDATGAAYVTGNTGSIDFPTAGTPFDSTCGIGPVSDCGGASFFRDAFVTKLDAAGSVLVYSTYLGGSQDDMGVGIAVDVLGQAYVTGKTVSPDFPAPGGIDTTCGTGIGDCNGGGVDDAFVTKFNAAGSALIYSTYHGGSGIDQGIGIAVDAAGAAYITGSTTTSDTSFPLAAALQSVHGGGFEDAFVSKFNAAGSVLVYSTYLGDSGGDRGSGIAVDAAGAAYVVGETSSNAFPTCGSTGGPGTLPCVFNGAPLDGTPGGSADAFVTKFNAAGSALVYSTYLAGFDQDSGFDIAVDLAGQAYVTGMTESQTDFPTCPNAGGTSPCVSAGTPLQSIHGGDTFDVFITKLNAAGSALIYSTYHGGSNNDIGNGIAVDAAGTAYVAGWTESSADFPLAAALQPTIGGGRDAFVSKICNDPPPGTSPGRWSTTGTLSSIRARHAATLLSTGTVLIAGGSDGSDPVASAELYNPATGLFADTDSLATARFGATASRLPNGTVLIAGGSTFSNALASAELYDPSDGTFSSTDSLTFARQSHTATPLSNGLILFVGGCIGAGNCTTHLDSAELYNPSTGLFSATGSLGTTRAGHTATRLANGTVLIVGGEQTPGTPLATAELYDPVTGLFTAAGTMGTARSKHTASLLPNGEVLVVGGIGSGSAILSSSERYTPTLDTFTPSGDLQIPRSSHGTITLADGSVVIFGGLGAGVTILSSTERYEPIAETFGLQGAMATTRLPFDPVLLPSGQILVAGGTSATGFSFFSINDAEVFTPNLCGPEADLSVSVVDSPDPVKIGTLPENQLQYDLTITNLGSAEVDEATITIPVPTGLTFFSVSGANCPDTTTDPIICTIGPLATDDAPLVTVVWDTDAADPGIRTNPVEVEWVGNFDPDIGNNTVEVETIVQSENPTSDLVLTITDNEDPVALSPGTFRYDLNINNMGTDVAINTVVTAEIPPGVTYNGSNLGGSCTGTTTVTCNLGDLDVMTSIMFSLNVTAGTAGNKTLTATATSTGPNAVPDADLTNNTNIVANTLVAESGQHIFVVNDAGDASDFDLVDDVCSVSSGGPCTLRAAIEQANSTANDPGGPDIIAFNIGGGGVQIISPGGALPALVQPATLDGTTQPGFVGTPLIELDGSGAPGVPGLHVTGGTSTVRGLVINRWSANGILLETNGSNTIEGNFIGTDPTGMSDLGNSSDGIQIVGSNNNTIGGLTAGARNVISGNSGDGIDIQGPSSGNMVQGNYIGVNAVGTGALANSTAGVFINASSGNTIGGTTSSARNIISGNAQSGIFINQTGSINNMVEGNYIGLNALGTAPIQNLLNGILIQDDANGNTIGGVAVGAGNVVSGNNQFGIHILNSATGRNVIQGNIVGLDATGNMADVDTDPTNGNEFGNEFGGIKVVNSSQNCIGGSLPPGPGNPCMAPFVGNVVGGNGRPGFFARNLEIETFGGGSVSTNNSIQGNIIGMNMAGTVSMGQTNTASGIALDADVGSFVGGIEGTTPHIENVQVGACTGACNLISGHRNAEGITVAPSSTGAIIQGNYIGTDITGTITDPTPGAPGSGDEFGNDLEGIVAQTATNAVIGGTTPAGRNIIAGNGFNPMTPVTKFNGIRIAGGSGHAISGNFIGTDKTGLVARGNFANGILVSSGATGVTIGGTAIGAGNVISGNEQYGIQINGATATSNLVQGNMIGTDSTGTVDLGNVSGGVLIGEASGNTIGGTDPGAGNLISGNGDLSGNPSNPPGVTISGVGSVGNLVQGNLIGTDVTGTAALPNFVGLRVTMSASGNTIGGTVAGARNVISGNLTDGVRLSTGATGNLFSGNFIGTDVNGTATLGNGIGSPIPDVDAGVRITDNSNDNTIGGTTAEARNIISGNAGHGMDIGNVAGTVIQGNFIGTDVNGTADLGNGNAGVRFFGGSANNIIGGTASEAGNIIAFNASDGVRLLTTVTSGHAIQGNTIFSNGELGIDFDLGVLDPPSGVTPNDPSDADTGQNNLQNYPVLTSAVSDGGFTTIIGSLNSTPGMTFRVEFFSNTACDGSGNGEGETFLGSTSVLTNGSGDASINATFSTIVPVGEAITATATDLGGNTSEFSACVTVAAAGPNTPPNITSLEVTTATEGVQYVYNVIATDSDAGDVLTFTLDNGPEGMFIAPETGAMLWTPTDAQAQASPQNVTARVSDRVLSVEGEVLVNGGFETDETTTPGGVNIPDTPGDWVGDITALVTAQDGITPIEGTHMVQFIGTTNTGASELTTGSEILQIIDLTPYAAQVATGQMIATASGQFNRVAGDAQTDTSFRIEWFAFDGDPSDLPTLVAGGALDGARPGQGLTTDADPTSWEPLSVSIQIPPTATYLVVDYIALEDVENDAEAPEFDGHYGDAFTVSLNTVGGMSDTQAFSITVQNTITVNSTDDPGVGTCDVTECTLREAITLSNATPGTDTIIFNIDNATFPLQNGAHTIQPDGVGLPTISDPVIIDGTTEPDFAGTPIIELDGTNAGPGENGLFITAGDSVVQGLILNRFTDFGLNLAIGGSNVVRGNYVGTDVTGTLPRPNGQSGIFLGDGTTLNVVGGTTGVTVNGPCTGDCNLISGNTNAGIQFGTSATNNTIIGNFIGTKVNGTENLGNGGNGIFVGDGSNNNIIGGTTPQQRNVISGNSIGVTLSAVSNTLIRGNHVGTDISGNFSLSNASVGVSITNSPNNIIGGLDPGVGNVISGNASTGVRISLSASTGNVVQGNLIGTKANGTEMLANGGDGILIRSASGNTVGGTTAAARNIISGNTGVGVELLTINLAEGPTENNVVEGNFIGTDATGTATLPNATGGIDLNGGAFNNHIGGTTGTTAGGPCTGACNLISGNGGSGLRLLQFDGRSANGNFIEGNFIGTKMNGTEPLPNTFTGVLVLDSHTNTIGGTSSGAGNLISGNPSHGITIQGSGSTANLVQGNLIGTNAAGTGPLGNGVHGVSVNAAATGNVIGGVTIGAGNVISGNTLVGVSITNAAAGNFVQGNFIGTNAAGSGPVANGSNGVGIDTDAANNLIGGTVGNARNVISGNLNNGIEIKAAGSTGNLVQGNVIGTNVGGTVSLPNAFAGVHITNAVGNTIGGTSVQARNVISGNNAQGILIQFAQSTGNAVQGNYIGTQSNGNAALPNTGVGIAITDGASTNTIGGTLQTGRNVISGNGQHGILLQNSGTTGNMVTGNFIGTTQDGIKVLKNQGSGIFITQAASNNTIGSIVDNEANVISGNNAAGLQLTGTGTSGNSIIGNLIGTDQAATRDLGNGSEGIAVSSAASGNSIGGVVSGSGNTIAYNTVGVVLNDGTTNVIRSNKIFLNDGLGINLIGGNQDSFGVTENDTGDGDTGPNNLQNYPVLTTSTTDTVLGETTLTGTFSSTPNTTFTLEIFRAGQCDASGFGEGETLVHTTPVTTDGSGQVELKIVLTPAILFGLNLTATATDPAGNTSEFSNCIEVTPALFALTVVKTGPGNGTVESVPDNGEDITCAGNIDDDCDEIYAQNAVVTIRAEAEAGTSEFIRWDGQGCQGFSLASDPDELNPECMVTMAEARTVTAIFCQIGADCLFSPPPTDLECGVPSADGTQQLTNTPGQVTCGWQLPVLPAGLQLVGVNFYQGTEKGVYGSPTFLAGSVPGLPVTLHTAALPPLGPGTEVFFTVTTVTQTTSGLVLEQALTSAASPGENESGLAVEASCIVPLGLEAWDIAIQGNSGSLSWECQEDVVMEGGQCDEISQSGDIHTANGDPIARLGTYLALRDGFPQGRADINWQVNLKSQAEGDLGVMFRLENQDTYYRFSMSRQGGYRRLVRAQGGSFEVLCEENFVTGIADPFCGTLPFNPGPGETAYEQDLFYNFIMTLDGSNLTLFLKIDQGPPVFTWEFTDEDPAMNRPLRGNGFALYTAENPGTRFDNFGIASFDDLPDLPSNVRSIEVRQTGPGRGRVQADIPGLQCSPDCAETVVDEADLEVMLTAVPDPGSTFVGWTEDVSGCATGDPITLVGLDQVMVPLPLVFSGTRCLIAKFEGPPPSSYTLDVDSDGVLDADDGKTVVAYLFGLRGQALLDIGANATSQRPEVGAIESCLDQAEMFLAESMLDVDADGKANPMTDGQIILRFIQGLTGPDLTTGVVNPLGNRTDPEEIIAFLEKFVPTGPSALTGGEGEGSAALTGEIAEPTLTPAPEVEPEGVTKPDRRKGQEKKGEKRRGRRSFKKR